MFKINLSKLSDFDTQVMTLINLSPGSWQIGTAPRLVCRHEQLGWFHRHWIFGVQPMITTPGSSRVRSLTWRGQILLRRKVREIKRSAVDLNVPESIAPAPMVGASNVPLSAGLSGMAMGGMVGRGGGKSIASAVQAMQQATPSTQQQMQRLLNSHMADAAMFGVDMAARPKPYQVIQMQTDLSQPMVAGHTRKAFLDSGRPPQVVDQAFKGDESAMCAAVDWAMQHM